MNTPCANAATIFDSDDMFVHFAGEIHKGVFQGYDPIIYWESWYQSCCTRSLAGFSLFMRVKNIM